MLVSKQFKFDAAHFLTDYNGKCEEPHGHTYKLLITLDGKVQDDGLVYDFCELKKVVVEDILSKLDHKDLNKLFKNPSTENIAMWIWDQLEDVFPQHVKLYEVKVWETETSSVTYRG
jgi:6-pyruvoyltetrahydropterin/6-carboxytetrahydropterin synthase